MSGSIKKKKWGHLHDFPLQARRWHLKKKTELYEAKRQLAPLIVSGKLITTKNGSNVETNLCHFFVRLTVIYFLQVES